MTSHTQLRTSSGRVIATFTTWAPPQSWPTRWTGCSKRSNSVTSQRRYSSTVAVNRGGQANDGSAIEERSQSIPYGSGLGVAVDEAHRHALLLCIKLEHRWWPT